MSDYYKKYLKYKEKYLTLQRKIQQRGGAYKNVLLIIDPQNDFSDDRIGYTPSLPVGGSTKDYGRIIEFINRFSENYPGEKLDEIHISLDTHTQYHIGHTDFWQIIDKEGDKPRNPEPNELKFSLVSYNDVTKKITAKSVITNKELVIIPRIIPGEKKNYPNIVNYVNNYVQHYGGYAFIWPYHCLEQKIGNDIAVELKEPLRNYKTNGGVVKYHIKGQNQLTEMFSIFGAKYELPVDLLSVLGPDSKYIYEGENSTQYNNMGKNTYDEAKICRNLASDINIPFMNELLGTNNRIFVCGEAKTHCVKESMIHLMKHANTMSVSPDRIVLLANMTSPIPFEVGGIPDDIEQITKDNGFTIKTVQEVYRVKDSSKEFTWKEIENLFNQKSNQLAKNNPKLYQNNKYKQDLDKLRKLRNELNFKEINSILSSYPLTNDGKGLAGGNINY